LPAEPAVQCIFFSVYFQLFQIFHCPNTSGIDA
jgi:hypothetical protein